jgi:hypothetical protein
MVSQKLSEARFLNKSFLKEVWRKLFLEKVSSKRTLSINWPELTIPEFSAKMNARKRVNYYSATLTGNSYLMVSQKLSEARFLDKSFLKEVRRNLFLCGLN